MLMRTQLPNSLHYEWTRCALEAGKHVLCEKAMADVSVEAKELTRLAAQKKLVLFEGVHWLYAFFSLCNRLFLFDTKLAASTPPHNVSSIW